jgi:hypothetical protein
MKIEPRNIPIGWTALVKESKCYVLREFPKGGKYFGKLTIVSKPTEEELKSELERLKIPLPA